MNTGLRKERLVLHVDLRSGALAMILLEKSWGNDQGRGVIVVRAHASRAEGLRLESDSMP